MKHRAQHIIRLAVVVGFIFLSRLETIAQCAMCRAVLESDVAESGNRVSEGINDGIVWLMGFPYLLMFGIALYVFRDKLGDILKGKY